MQGLVVAASASIPAAVQVGTAGRSGHQRHIDPKVRLSDSGLTALSLGYI